MFWAGTEGVGEHNKVKGTWHSARTTDTEWPEEKRIPGIYLEYTDGVHVVEWTAMDLFGDTVQMIPAKTKKMKHNRKNKKRKHEQAPGYTETFPEEATEWLGYGSLLKVRFKSKWRPGQVIGRGTKGILVQYSDGVGEHDDLHSRGCRVKVFRRRVDMDELYDSTPWLLCPLPAEGVVPRSGLGDIVPGTCRRKNSARRSQLSWEKERSGWKITL